MLEVVNPPAVEAPCDEPLVVVVSAHVGDNGADVMM